MLGWFHLGRNCKAITSTDQWNAKLCRTKWVDKGQIASEKGNTTFVNSSEILNSQLVWPPPLKSNENFLNCQLLTNATHIFTSVKQFYLFYICFPLTRVSNINLEEAPISLCATPKEEFRISGFSHFPRIDCLLYPLPWELLLAERALKWNGETKDDNWKGTCHLFVCSVRLGKLHPWEISYPRPLVTRSSKSNDEKLLTFLFAYAEPNILINIFP